MFLRLELGLPTVGAVVPATLKAFKSMLPDIWQYSFPKISAFLFIYNERIGNSELEEFRYVQGFPKNGELLPTDDEVHKLKSTREVRSNAHLKMFN